MANGEVNLLCAVGTIGWDDDGVVGQLFELPAVSRGEGKDRNPFRRGGFTSPKHVGGCATRRVGDEKVPRLAQSFDLPSEDGFESEIVSSGRQYRRVRRKGDGRHRPPLSGVPNNKLGGHMLRVGGTASVAAKQQRSSVGDRFADHRRAPLYVRFKLIRGSESEFGKVSEPLRVACQIRIRLATPDGEDEAFIIATEDRVPRSILSIRQGYSGD